MVALAAHEGHVVCDRVLHLKDLPQGTAALQDQGAPGRDGCDMTDHTHGYGVGANTLPILGFDCRLRDAHGRVIARFPPNRPDGLCGQDAPKRR